MNQHKGSRWSATKAYLRPIISRKNLTVLTYAHVKKIRIETSDRVKVAKGVVASINKSNAKLRPELPKQLHLSIKNKKVAQHQAPGHPTSFSRIWHHFESL